MTKDEIVSALRCCISADFGCCKPCPAAQEDGCEDAIKACAADLIENQQREIEALRQANRKIREAHYHESAVQALIAKMKKED